MEHIKRLKDRSKGFSKLENTHNTCYLNAVIQSLANNYKFVHYIKKNKTIKLNNNDDTDSNDDVNYQYKEIVDFTQKEILVHLIKLLRGMWRGNYIIKPTSFYKSFITKFPSYKMNEQHDAREFLFDLMGEVNSSLEQKCIAIQTSKYTNTHYTSALKEWRNYFENKRSYISDNFYGQYIRTYTCKECGLESYNYSPFLTIHIKPEQKGIEELLYSSMTLDFLNKTCEGCSPKGTQEELEDISDHIKSPEHSIETQLYKLPQTLIVSVDLFTRQNSKVQVKVDINKKIDLYKKFVCNTDEVSTYKLSSIIYHQGDLNSGHYFTVVYRNGKYNLFNDTEVIKDLDSIQKIKSTPYLIFYEKQNNK